MDAVAGNTATPAGSSRKTPRKAGQPGVVIYGTCSDASCLFRGQPRQFIHKTEYDRHLRVMHGQGKLTDQAVAKLLEAAKAGAVSRRAAGEAKPFACICGRISARFLSIIVIHLRGMAEGDSANEHITLASSLPDPVDSSNVISGSNTGQNQVHIDATTTTDRASRDVITAVRDSAEHELETRFKNDLRELTRAHETELQRERASRNDERRGYERYIEDLERHLEEDRATHETELNDQEVNYTERLNEALDKLDESSGLIERLREALRSCVQDMVAAEDRLTDVVIALRRQSTWDEMVRVYRILNDVGYNLAPLLANNIPPEISRPSSDTDDEGDLGDLNAEPDMTAGPDLSDDPRYHTVANPEQFVIDTFNGREYRDVDTDE